jgi:hypothetical protein
MTHDVHACFGEGATELRELIVDDAQWFAFQMTARGAREERTDESEATQESAE